MSVVPEQMQEFRDLVANRFVAGEGIEIGPGNSPIRLDTRKAHARYVDIAPIEELVAVHNVPAGWAAPDVIDDADTLQTFDDGSLDFIIACHVLEHTQDPLGVLSTWLRKLRPQGVAFVAVPDRRFSFDRDRPLTSIGHVIDDYLNGAHHSEDDHLWEWVTLVDKVADETAARAQVAEMKRLDLRPHYHVWETESFLDLLVACRGVHLDFEFEFCGRNDTETIVVLRKPALA